MLRAVGAAKAEAYKLGVGAIGEAGYTAMQIATILGENNVKVVPELRSAATVRQGWRT